MVGDDVVNDIGGSQACALKGVQVRTGKYRSAFNDCNINYKMLLNYINFVDCYAKTSLKKMSVIVLTKSFTSFTKVLI